MRHTPKKAIHKISISRFQKVKRAKTTEREQQSPKPTTTLRIVNPNVFQKKVLCNNKMQSLNTISKLGKKTLSPFQILYPSQRQIKNRKDNRVFLLICIDTVLRNPSSYRIRIFFLQNFIVLLKIFFLFKTINTRPLNSRPFQQWIQSFV